MAIDGTGDGMLSRKYAGLLVAILSVLSALFLQIGAAQAAPPLEVYGQLPGLEYAAISPSGEHVAIIGLVDGKRNLVLNTFDGSAPKVVPLGEMKVRGIYWAGDDMVLIKASTTAALSVDFVAKNAELEAMLVVPVNGEKSWTVFANAKKITGGIRGFYGLRQHDGRWFGYFGGITHEEGKENSNLVSTLPVLYEVDLQTHDNRKIGARADGEALRSWLVDAQGIVSVTLDFRSDNSQWRIRNGSGAQIATGTAPLGEIDLVGFGPDADTVVYEQTDPDSAEDRWYQQPLAGGVAKEIVPNGAADNVYVDGRSGRMLGYVIRGDMRNYRFFDARQNKVMAATLKAFPDLNVRLVGWSDSFNRLLVVTEGDRDPMTWWTVDIKTGDAKVLGSSYAIKGDDVAPTRMITYKGADGLDIAAVLTLPPGKLAKDLPVIVLPHDGPADRDYPGFDWRAQAFASRGYAVLQPNFRGSTGYGAAFEKAGHSEWGRKMQSDISDGLAKLVQDGIVDGKRACIIGASYGGYAALVGVTMQKGLYRCAGSVTGISDIPKWAYTQTSRYVNGRTIGRGIRNDIGAGRDLDAISPLRFAASADAPILLIHGKDDTVVDYAQSTAMAAALTRAGKLVEFVTLPGGDHWLLNSETRLAMLKAAVAFVEKYNPPSP